MHSFIIDPAIELTVAMATVQAKLEDLHRKYTTLSQQPVVETVGPTS